MEVAAALVAVVATIPICSMAVVSGTTLYPLDRSSTLARPLTRADCERLISTCNRMAGAPRCSTRVHAGNLTPIGDSQGSNNSNSVAVCRRRSKYAHRCCSRRLPNFSDTVSSAAAGGAGDDNETRRSNRSGVMTFRHLVVALVLAVAVAVVAAVAAVVVVVGARASMHFMTQTPRSAQRKPQRSSARTGGEWLEQQRHGGARTGGSAVRGGGGLTVVDDDQLGPGGRAARGNRRRQQRWRRRCARAAAQAGEAFLAWRRSSANCCSSWAPSADVMAAAKGEPMPRKRSAKRRSRQSCEQRALPPLRRPKGMAVAACSGLQQRAVLPDAELKARNDRLAAAFGQPMPWPLVSSSGTAGFGTRRTAALAPPAPPGLGGGISPRPENSRPPPGLAGLAPSLGPGAAPEGATVVGDSVNAPDTAAAEDTTAAAGAAESAEAEAKAEAEAEARNEARRAKAAADAAEHEALCKRFGFKSSTITPAPRLISATTIQGYGFERCCREDVSANASRRWGNSG